MHSCSEQIFFLLVDFMVYEYMIIAPSLIIKPDMLLQSL